MKKLKLRIVKFDRLLVVEQLERDGVFKNSERVRISGYMCLDRDWIDLPESCIFRSADSRKFSDNQERDEYAANLIRWITEEQFGGAGKLEIGKPCLVRNSENVGWEERIFAGKLSQNARERDALFLTESEFSRACFMSWKYAKPLNSAQPKIDGEIYTWEIEE